MADEKDLQEDIPVEDKEVVEGAGDSEERDEASETDVQKEEASDTSVAEDSETEPSGEEEEREGKEDKKLFKKKQKADKKQDALKEKIDELEDKVKRQMAEFDNYRRRTSQEKLDLVSMAAVDTIKGLLPILDDFERALKVLGESGDSDAAKEGTQLIYTKLMSFLKGKGLAVIEAQGQPFDTDLHEAVAQFPVQEEGQKGKVFDVCQTGYTLNGKVIRFAKVVVGI